MGFKFAEALAGRFDVTLLSSPPTQTPVGAKLVPCDAGSCSFNDVGAVPLLRFELRQHALARQLSRSSRFDFVHRLTPSAIQQPSWVDRLGIPLIVGPIIAANPPPAPFRPYLDRPVSLPAQPRIHPSRIFSRLCRCFVASAARRQRYLARASRILVGTRTALSQIPEQFRNKCRLITYSGVEHDVFVPRRISSNSSAQSLRVLFVGRLIPYKGVELLIHAAALASKRCALELDLICSPDLEYKRFLIQVASDLGLAVHETEDTQYALRNAPAPASRITHHASRVRFLPAVRRSELPSIYQQCDLFCFPTLCDTYGIALLEAMSCGCAVLASDVAGAGEIINGKNGLKIPLATPDQYISECAEKIVACAQNPALREGLGSTARQYILAHHDWPRVSAQLLSFYDELQDDSPRPDIPWHAEPASGRAQESRTPALHQSSTPPFR